MKPILGYAENLLVRHSAERDPEALPAMRPTRAGAWC